MSFGWKDYIDLAENLLEHSEESCLRSAVSRAYYGAFCIARNAKGFKDSTGGNIHRKVINEYKNSSDKNERDIGQILDKLRRARNNADYNEDKPVTKGIAERAVISAKYILTSMEIS